MKDGGADGFIDADISEEQGKPTHFFQASKQLTVETKIRGTIARLREVGRTPKLLHYASSQLVPHSDKVKYDLGEELDVAILIYDRAFFVQHANENPDVVAAFNQYLLPAIAFLEDLKGPSFPALSPFPNAQAVCAFLAHELERRIGATRTLETVCDGLILWGLEGTDPDLNIFMSQADILAKVEAVIPTARRFLRGQIEQRLTALTTKESGSRYVNVYKRKGVYCLPYESRTAIRDSIVEDENLKLSLTQRFRERLLEQGGAELDASVLETIPSLLHKTLEIVFERQGYDAARHFLEDNGEQLSPKPIVQIAEEVLAESSISPALHAKVGTLMKGVMRDVFYRSNATERTYCARLARTDIMLFTIKNTPEIIEHFNSMSKFRALRRRGYRGARNLRVLSASRGPDDRQRIKNY
jgi:hypothetical protein